jgi:beta-galactosidase
MNNKILFNNDWEFAKTKLEEININDLNFESLDIPHDWLIYNTLDLYENSIGWYCKKFKYSKNEKQVLLYFDGVYMNSFIYVNGQFIGEWKNGYSSFEYEITEALIDGENEILIKVIHESLNSRWYSGAGIYRNVWLKIRDKSHIVTDGIYITTKESSNSWEVEIDTELNIFGEAKLSHIPM